jgi:hypothetical protein
LNLQCSYFNGARPYFFRALEERCFEEYTSLGALISSNKCLRGDGFPESLIDSAYLTAKEVSKKKRMARMTILQEKRRKNMHDLTSTRYFGSLSSSDDVCSLSSCPTENSTTNSRQEEQRKRNNRIAAEKSRRKTMDLEEYWNARLLGYSVLLSDSEQCFKSLSAQYDYYVQNGIPILPVYISCDDDAASRHYSQESNFTVETRSNSLFSDETDGSVATTRSSTYSEGDSSWLTTEFTSRAESTIDARSADDDTVSVDTACLFQDELFQECLLELEQEYIAL